MIEISDSKLVTITGGKWTTFRRMAEVRETDQWRVCSSDRNRDEAQAMFKSRPHRALGAMEVEMVIVRAVRCGAVRHESKYAREY